MKSATASQHVQLQFNKAKKDHDDAKKGHDLSAIVNSAMTFWHARSVLKTELAKRKALSKKGKRNR